MGVFDLLATNLFPLYKDSHETKQCLPQMFY